MALSKQTVLVAVSAMSVQRSVYQKDIQSFSSVPDFDEHVAWLRSQLAELDAALLDMGYELCNL